MSKSSRFSNNKRKTRFTKGEQNKKFQPSNRKFNFQNPTRSFTRFKFFIEYDGTRYSGWQKQENAKTYEYEDAKFICEKFNKENCSSFAMPIYVGVK